MRDLKLSAGVAEGTAEFFDPVDPAFRADPWPTYRRLRDEAPVHRNPLGAIVVARYDDCSRLLRDPRLGKDLMKSKFIRSALEAGGTPPFLGLGLASDAKPFLLSDPPDHTRLRGLVSSAFTPAVVRQVRPAIAAAVKEFVDHVSQARRWDAVADLGYRLPLRVLGDLLGIPEHDRSQFRAWSRAIAGMLEFDFAVPPDVIQQREMAMESFRCYFESLLEDRAHLRGDDLVSCLVTAHDAEGSVLTRGEIISICILLIMAALETMANLVGNGILALSRAPGAWEALHERPELRRNAVEEILRYEPPAHEVGRVTLEELDLGGTVVPPGEMILMLLASANRDERHFAQADRLDLERNDKSHLSFGSGIHYCLGAPLARAMAEELFSALPCRLRRIEVLVEFPQYKDGFGLRGPAVLPVESDAR